MSAAGMTERIAEASPGLESRVARLLLVDDHPDGHPRNTPLIQSLTTDATSMSTGVMTEPITEASPRFKARIAGVFYFLTFLTGGVAVFVSGRLVVSGDAAATATSILAHEGLFRLAFAAHVITVACHIAVTLLFYDLFKPVNRSLSLFAAFFSLVGFVIQASACLFHLATLVVLGGAQYLSVFRLEQLQALALMFLELHAQAFNIGLVFFGFYCLLIGYLVEVHLPASNPGRADGVCRSGLADFSVTAARRVSVARHSGPRPSRGRIADPVASAEALTGMCTDVLTDRLETHSSRPRLSQDCRKSALIE